MGTELGDLMNADSGERPAGEIDYTLVGAPTLMRMREHILPLLAEGIPLPEECRSVLAELSAEVQEAMKVHLRARGIEPAGFRDDACDGGGETASQPGENDEGEDAGESGHGDKDSDAWMPGPDEALS